jgi:exopolysaccharide production protein ExoZ
MILPTSSQRHGGKPTLRADEISKRNRRGTIESLQAGRGAAALAVVLLHCSLAGHDFGGPYLGYQLFRFGYLGVDFFFVLSGFIIYHSTVGKNRTVGEYVMARFRRVYLPYWPVGIAMALAYTLLPGVSAANSQWSWLPTLTLAPVDANPALSVAWTLKHEILFYALFGIFYFSGLLPVGLAAWALAILLLGDHLPFRTINLEFFFGIAAAISYRHLRVRPWLLLVAPAFVALWVVMGADEADRIFVGAAMAFIVAPVAELERSGLRVPKPLIQLGAVSYSLYLVHEPFISAIARLIHGSWPILIAGAVASVAAGFAYHYAVEKRVIQQRANPEVFEA